MVSWGVASLPEDKSWDVHLVQGSATSSPYTAKKAASLKVKGPLYSCLLIVRLPSGNRTFVICKPSIVDIVQMRQIWPYSSKIFSTSESYFRLAPSSPPLSFSMPQGMTELPTLQEHHRSYLFWYLQYSLVPRLLRSGMQNWTCACGVSMVFFLTWEAPKVERG